MEFFGCVQANEQLFSQKIKIGKTLPPFSRSYTLIRSIELKHAFISKSEFFVEIIEKKG